MNRMDILANIENPALLEKMYRDNKSVFKTEFNMLYPELRDHQLAAFWHERLTYESSELSWGNKKDLTFVIIAALIAGLIAKLPAILNIDPESFYLRNIGFIVFPILTTYFIWKKGNPSYKTILIFAITLIALVFINLFPGTEKSDTLILSCIHIPLLLWAVLGYAFAGENLKDFYKRIDFLKYNGDLAILTALLLISGGILTAITMMLFSVIGFNIEQFYADYVITIGLAALPIVATYIVQTNPQLVNRISPLIAKLFSPLVLTMLIIYLIAISISGKDPYNDRDFLMTFNLLLIGVMAIIFFSVSGNNKNKVNQADSFILLALSIVTAVVNGIALSAILFRISEWGITPNRLAILGGNILILTNLLIVTHRLFWNASKKGGMKEVENSISKFLPVYIIWTIIVIFLFPFIFNFK